MDTRAFLEAVWPAQGIYFLAWPLDPTNPRSPFAHQPFHSIEAVAAAVARRRSKDNLFFCVHTAKEERLWNPLKKDRKTGALGAWEKRSHANMHEGKCFFFDLDVGESTATTPKYPTRQEALDGLEQFLFRTQLPDPLVTSSGGGFHVYWRLSDAITSLDWRRHATALHYVARREGLRADPARTNDQSSVLRIVGTNNLKPGREPRPCVALQGGVVTVTEEFLARLAELLGSTAIPAEALAPRGAQAGNLARAYENTVAVTLDELAAECEHVLGYKESVEAGENPAEPVWYHLGCGLLQYTDEGVDAVLELRKPTRSEAETLAKLDQYNDACESMPPSCSTLDKHCGGDACAKCPITGLGKNPLLAIGAARKKRVLPPPTISLSLVAAQPAVVVEPPFPYKRTAAGIVRKDVKKDKDGNEVEVEDLICPYDMFPFEACERTELERAFTLWAVVIPLKGQIVIKIASTMLQDIRQLHTMLSDYGVVLTRRKMDMVMDFMAGYIRRLQEASKANRQFDHLGWANPAHTEFILPNSLIKLGGAQSPCTVSGVVQDVARGIRTEGTLADQVQLLDYYNDDKYLKHQFVALCGLAAPAFHVTDFAGSVINAAGESGGGKSSAVATAASLWGHPVDFVINGTQTGMTLLAQQHRVFTISNLPVCVDEITTHEDPEVRKFVLGSTQPHERGGLQANGQPRPVRETYKSTFYLVTSNKSFHNLLGQGAEVGNASTMRVFEMWFPEFKTGKIEAQEFMAKVMHCYGWIGPAALGHYMTHKAHVDTAIRTFMAKMDRRYNFTGPERYWSADIAVPLVYGEFAQSYRLIPFNLKRLRDWLLDEHLPLMRGAIRDDNEAHNSMSVLSEFLNDQQGRTLITHNDVSDRTQYPVQQINGALVAEYDKSTEKIYICKNTFRKWLGDRKHNGLKTIGELVRDKVITAADMKRTLGVGTNYARGRVICLVVDRTHPEFAAAHAGTMAPKSNVVPLRKGATS